MNALVHRDYLLAGGQVRVFVFDDRVEVSSPGRLPNSLPPEDLFAGAQPYRRDQILAGFLRDFESTLTGRAYTEGRAEGFLTLVRESEKLSGRTPALRQGSEAVTVTIVAGPRADARAAERNGSRAFQARPSLDQITAESDWRGRPARGRSRD